MEEPMARSARDTIVQLGVTKGDLRWVEEHRLQVRLWFSGLPACDREELLDLMRKYPLLTYQALRSVVETQKPR